MARLTVRRDPIENGIELTLSPGAFIRDGALGQAGLHYLLLEPRSMLANWSQRNSLGRRDLDSPPLGTHAT